MTVNKRLRYEVLKRDGFRCTYCGAAPLERQLHVDHVVPVALGGTDIPENLTTACEDCNSGKASTSPTDDMVAAVDLAIAVHRAAQFRSYMAMAEATDRVTDFEAEVLDIWETHVPSYRMNSATAPSLTAINSWWSQRVPIKTIEWAIRIAVEADIPWTSKAQYVDGIIRNKLLEVEGNGGT